MNIFIGFFLKNILIKLDCTFCLLHVSFCAVAQRYSESVSI